MHIAVGRTLSDREAWAFLIVTLSFAVCGGSLGAVAGAISGGVARCWTRKGVTSSQ
jgi:hypothetical protein